MSLVGPRPCIPYETEHFEPHHFERFLVPAGHHRALAGDGARALDLRRGARHGRRLRAQLVARPRPRCSAARRAAARPEGEPMSSERVRGTPSRVRSSRCASPSSASATGARTSSATCTSSTDAELAAVCDLRPGAARRRRAGATRASARRREFDEVLADPTIDAVVDRDARLDAPRARRRRAARRASTCSSRSRSRPRRRRRSTLIAARRRARPRAHAGPHVPVQPAREHDPRADRRRRARRDLLHLDEPREPRPAPARRQRRLGSRPARLLDPALLARRDADARDRAQPRLRHPGHARRRVHQPRVPRRARSPTSSCRGSRRASSGGPTIVGSEKMVVYDDTSTEPVRIFDSGVELADPEDASASTS